MFEIKPKYEVFPLKSRHKELMETLADLRFGECFDIPLDGKSPNHVRSQVYQANILGPARKIKTMRCQEAEWQVLRVWCVDSTLPAREQKACKVEKSPTA